MHSKGLFNTISNDKNAEHGTYRFDIPHTYSVFYSHWLSHSNVIDNKYYFYMGFQFLWFFSSNFRYQSVSSSFFLLFFFVYLDLHSVYQMEFRIFIKILTNNRTRRH